MRKLSSIFTWVLLIAASLCLSGSSVMAYVQVQCPDDSLPPLAGTYVSPAQWHAAFAQGIIIRGVQHNKFTRNLPVPQAERNNSKFGGCTDRKA